MKTISQKQKTDKKGLCSRKMLLRTALLILLVLSLLFYRDSLLDILKGIRLVTWKELGAAILLALSGYLLEGITIFQIGRASWRERV